MTLMQRRSCAQRRYRLSKRRIGRRFCLHVSPGQSLPAPALLIKSSRLLAIGVEELAQILERLGDRRADLRYLADDFHDPWPPRLDRFPGRAYVDAFRPRTCQSSLERFCLTDVILGHFDCVSHLLPPAYRVTRRAKFPPRVRVHTNNVARRKCAATAWRMTEGVR